MLTDFQILTVMQAVKDHGGLIMVHAEGLDAIRFMNQRLAAEGRTAPRYHATSRPVPVEREATHRALALAELVGVPVMIVHVSNGEAIEEIERARARGVRVFAETCPQYLVLTEDDMEGDALEGAKYVCSPPPRDGANQEACWRGLETAVFDVFSSDHCPYRYDTTGKLNPDAGRGYQWIPNGIPGIETRLPILFSKGVGTGRIDLNRFVALTATNHAKLYGLYPQKGTIAVGADADIAIWDPGLEVTIGQEVLHHGCDYTPYEGIAVTGWPVTTILRGQVVVRDRRLVAGKGVGGYRGRSRAGLGGAG
jgi:dihydropyrimidinase